MEFPFERAAMGGEAMPDCLRIYEQCAYLALRHLYAMYHRKAIPREEAAREKKKLRAQYEIAKADFETNRRNNLENAQMWKQIEAAANRYRTERTLENADAFVKAVYGVGRKKREERT